MGHKKGWSEVMVRAVMSLYDAAKTRVSVGSAYLKKFDVKVDVHQRSASCGMWTLSLKKQEGVWLMNYCMQMTLFS